MRLKSRPDDVCGDGFESNTTSDVVQSRGLHCQL